MSWKVYNTHSSQELSIYNQNTGVPVLGAPGVVKTHVTRDIGRLCILEEVNLLTRSFISSNLLYLSVYLVEVLISNL